MLPVSLSRRENIVQPTSGHLRLLPSHRSAGVSRSTTVASSFFAGFLPQSIEMDMESARFVSCSNLSALVPIPDIFPIVPVRIWILSWLC